jgi:hypothetical protein
MVSLLHNLYIMYTLRIPCAKIQNRKCLNIWNSLNVNKVPKFLYFWIKDTQLVKSMKIFQNLKTPHIGNTSDAMHVRSSRLVCCWFHMFVSVLGLPHQTPNLWSLLLDSSPASGIPNSITNTRFLPKLAAPHVRKWYHLGSLLPTFHPLSSWQSFSYQLHLESNCLLWLSWEAQ